MDFLLLKEEFERILSKNKSMTKRSFNFIRGEKRGCRKL